MLFQSLPFLVFFAVVYSGYLLVKGTRLRLPWLLVSSYVFYAWLSPLYLIPLAYATVVDYFVAGRIESSPRKRAWLTLSILNNVLVLGFFKYAGFVAEIVNALLSAMKVSYAISPPSFLLPAGLSIFLLQSIGYTIDVYRGTTKREKNFLAYAAFVSFFPRLLAGPIERANHLLPQLHGEGRVTLRDFTDGLSIFVVGYFKKVDRPTTWRSTSPASTARPISTRPPPCCWRRSCSPGRSTSTSAATPTWPAASRE